MGLETSQFRGQTDLAGGCTHGVRSRDSASMFEETHAYRTRRGGLPRERSCGSLVVQYTHIPVEASAHEGSTGVRINIRAVGDYSIPRWPLMLAEAREARCEAHQLATSNGHLRFPTSKGDGQSPGAYCYNHEMAPDEADGWRPHLLSQSHFALEHRAKTLQAVSSNGGCCRRSGHGKSPASLQSTDDDEGMLPDEQHLLGEGQSTSPRQVMDHSVHRSTSQKLTTPDPPFPPRWEPSLGRR